MGKLYQDIENKYGLPTTISPVSGAVSMNTPNIRGKLVFLFVKPTTSTTQWDLAITDERGRDIVTKVSEVGTLRDYVEIPIVGICTVAIANATVDEAFTILLRVEE